MIRESTPAQATAEGTSARATPLPHPLPLPPLPPQSAPPDFASAPAASPPRPAKPRHGRPASFRDLGGAFDLRFTRGRVGIDQVLERAAHLPDADRALVHAVYATGTSVQALAALTRQSPRVLRRRLRSLIDRLRSREFAFVVAIAPALPPIRRAIALACYVEGRTQRDVAHDLALTQYTVRRHREAILAMIDAADTARRARATADRAVAPSNTHDAPHEGAA